MSEHLEHGGKRRNKLDKPQVEGSKKLFEASTSFFGNLNLQISGPGAYLSSLFILFNSVTTIQGAQLILPPVLGAFVGSLLSFTYFILLVSRKIKQEHPWRRRFLLYLLFTPFSVYTSFFSIYQETTKDSLGNQSKTITSQNHSEYVTYLQRSVKSRIDKLEKDIPNIQQVQTLDKKEQQLDIRRQDQEKLRQDIGKFEQQDFTQANSSSIPLALQKFDEINNEIKEKEQEIFILKKNRGNPQYVEYSTLKQSSEELEKQLKSVDQNNTGDKHYDTAFKLHSNISYYLSNINPPDKDKYTSAPQFLVPYQQFISGGSAQKGYILFAFAIAVIMEVIPLILGGINLEINNNNKNAKSTIEAVIHIFEKIKDFDQKNDFSIKIIREFYNRIDRNGSGRSISINLLPKEELNHDTKSGKSKTPNTNSYFNIDSEEELEQQVFRLIIDIMSFEDLSWVRNKTRGSDKETWEFANKICYEDFLKWWIRILAQETKTDMPPEPEEINASVNLQGHVEGSKTDAL